MKRLGLLIAFFGLLFIVLPSLTAQDKDKKDPDKKDEAKKDDPKKTNDPEKKEKKEEPKKEKLVHGTVFYRTKLLSANAANGREFTIELKDVDQKKLADAQTWLAQRFQQFGQPVLQAQQQVAQAKDVKGRASAMQNLAKAQATYMTETYKAQVEFAKKDVSSTKSYDIRAHDDAKVRSNILPIEFDDLGFEKKWTKKEIEERKDKNGLPGYFPADFDQLKSGQYVDVYMAKVPKDKDQPKKKKGPDDDPPEVKGRPEFVLIVIVQQPAPPK